MMILIFKELEQLLMSLSQNQPNYRNRLLNITNECQMLSSETKSILGINTIKAISCWFFCFNIYEIWMFKFYDFL